MPRNDPRLALLSGYELEHEYRVYLAYRETGARIRLMERLADQTIQTDIQKQSESETRRSKIEAELRALPDTEKAELAAQYGASWLSVVTEIELASPETDADITTDSALELDELAGLIGDAPTPEEFARRVREAEARKAAG